MDIRVALRGEVKLAHCSSGNTDLITVIDDLRKPFNVLKLIAGVLKFPDEKVLVSHPQREQSSSEIFKNKLDRFNTRFR